MSPDWQPDRRSEILRAARVCFLDRGFVRTTISDIVAQCGGSRATIYEEFGSKEGLFRALVASVVEQMRLPELAAGPPQSVLKEFGFAYMERLMDPEVLALYRVAVGESGYVRQLGPTLFHAGPKSAASALAERLAAWQADGALKLDDPAQAANLFLAMLEGDLHRSALLWASAPTPEEIAGNVDAATELFMRGAGTPEAVV
jgi:TetR/AcrR family transcriptional regulator, mexJK operon transcriptional repressor